MLNTLLISIWAILVTLGIFYLQQSGLNDTGVKEAPTEVFKEIKSSTVSTALFNVGKPIGHFVTKVRFELPEKIHKELQIPIEFLIGDQLFSVLSAMDFKVVVRNKDPQKIAQKLEKALQTNEFPIKNITFENAEFILK